MPGAPEGGGALLEHGKGHFHLLYGAPGSPNKTEKFTMSEIKPSPSKKQLKTLEHHARKTIRRCLVCGEEQVAIICVFQFPHEDGLGAFGVGFCPQCWQRSSAELAKHIHNAMRIYSSPTIAISPSGEVLCYARSQTLQ